MENDLKWLDDDYELLQDAKEQRLDIFRVRLRFQWRGMSFEQLEDFREKVVAPLNISFFHSGTPAVRRLAIIRRLRAWLTDGEVAEKSVPCVRGLLRRVQNAHDALCRELKDFDHMYQLEKAKRESYAKGEAEGRAKGEKDGRDNAADAYEALLERREEKFEKEKEEIERKIERLKKKLAKLHLKHDCERFKKEVFKFVKDNIQAWGRNDAIRLALKKDWIVEGARHFNVFGANKEKDPTFAALKAAIKYQRNK